jgi:hypothetical protein
MKELKQTNIIYNEGERGNLKCTGHCDITGETRALNVTVDLSKNNSPD